MSDLKGKIALVTGASRGIGRATAVALGRAGADVGVNFLRREDESRQTVAEVAALGQRAVALQADVSQTAQVSRLVAAVENEQGPLDILINNAGITRPQPLEQITEQDFDDLIAVNLKSAFLMTQAVLRGCGPAAGAGSSTCRAWRPNSAAWSGRTTRRRRPACTG